MATKRVAKKAVAKVAATKNVKTAQVKSAEIKPEKVEIKEEAKEVVKEAPKAIETKKDTTKAIETKAAVLIEKPEAKAEENTTVKKAAAVKKPAAKKTTVKKTEVKTELFLQFSGKEYTEAEIFQKVKEIWTKVLKNKVGDMKNVQIYLKPEESAAYYVINGDTTGKVDL